MLFLHAVQGGNAAADGQDMVRGAQLAVDELNAAGGVNGYTFEVVVGDTRDQASDVVTSAFERLNGDHAVQMMMTDYASGSNFEIESMADNDMPYLISANSDQTRDIVAKDSASFPTVWSLTHPSTPTGSAARPSANCCCGPSITGATSSY